MKLLKALAAIFVFVFTIAPTLAITTVTDPTIYVVAYLTPTQLAAVKGGVNTTDVSSAISSAISACPATGCKIYFPAGYYYSATCNFTLGHPFTLQGDGTRSIDGVNYVTVIACGANSVPLFTANAILGLFRDISCLSVGFTPLSGSSCVVVTNGASNANQQVSFENVQVDGFYDSLDIAVGSNWHLRGSVIQNCAHWCARVRNTINADAGDWTMDDVQFQPSAGATASVRYESSGDGQMNNLKIVPMDSGVSDGISIDTTGHNSGQIIISNSKMERVKIPVNVAQGWPYMVFSGNILISGGVFPAISCNGCSSLTISGNTLVGTGNALTISNSSKVMVGCNLMNYQSGLLSTNNTLFTYNSSCNLSPEFYQGVGDIIGGATAYWDLSAYSLATTGTKAANICNAGDANCADVNTLANGMFDVTTATSAPLNCGGTGGTCTIKTLYDQTGNGHDATQATISKRPPLALNCIGLTIPCMTLSSAAATSLVAAISVTQAQPWTALAVFKETGTDAGGNMLSDFNVGNNELFVVNSGNNFGLFAAPTETSAAAARNNWHAGMGKASGATSEIVVDGTPTSPLTIGTGSFTGQFAIGQDGTGGDASINGQMMGLGFWPSAISEANMIAVTNNRKAFMGL